MPVRTHLCEGTVDQLLKEADIMVPPVDVKSLAESLFLQIIPSNTGEHGGRALLEFGEIHVNASEAPAGQRFSIGHEIGHYLLHRDGFVFSPHEDPDSELYAADPAKELESEANYFSSVLLVPPRWLRKDVEAGLMPSELAERYQVSQEVIFIALERHRLLNRVGQRRR